jgi:hypothetical protein
MVVLYALTLKNRSIGGEDGGNTKFVVTYGKDGLLFSIDELNRCGCREGRFVDTPNRERSNAAFPCALLRLDGRRQRKTNENPAGLRTRLDVPCCP